MISINQLKLSFGGFDLFKGFSFLVNPRDRIGLVGRNGAGKSTLLKMIAKEQEPTSGDVVYPKDLVIGYLPQTMIMSDGNTVMEEAEKAFQHIHTMKADIDKLNEQIATRTDYESDSYHKLIDRVTDMNDRFAMMGGENYHSEIEKTLMGLGFNRSDFNRQTSEFSGGWRMRIELAKLLLQRPNVFLLDEPTNHLDIESIQWLESFLKSYSGAVVLVSHDKAFLDNVTNRTVEISLGQIYDYKANYSHYVELRKERREQQLAAYENQQKMIKDTEDFIERFRYKPTKSVQVQSRIKQLEKLERIEVDVEDNRRLNMKFPPAPRSGKVVAEMRALSKSYGDLDVLKDIDFDLELGEKLAFVGKNGQGKTTLARVILGELEYSGQFKLGHNVKIGYFAQDEADRMDGELSVLDTIDQVAVGDVRTKIRDILGAFMFSGEDVEKKVKVLSGGERTRLAMIRLMLEPVNFLVLDEPTNHLDMSSKELLKDALKAFDGTLLVVSHDREFLDGLVSCVYEFKDQKIKQHLGGIYEFLQANKLNSMRELEEQGIKKGSSKRSDSSSSSEESDGQELSYEARKEISRKISRGTKAVEKAEALVMSIEEEIEKMDEKLADPENMNDQSLFTLYQEKKDSLEQAMSHWEELNEQLEELESLKTW